jgi:hypothetical protein
MLTLSNPTPAHATAAIPELLDVTQVIVTSQIEEAAVSLCGGPTSFAIGSAWSLLVLARCGCLPNTNTHAERK